MLRFSLLLALLLPVAYAYAYGGYDAEVLEVKDGDTVRVRIFAWPDHPVEIDVRVAGVNTPEKHPRKPSGMTDKEWEPLKMCEKGASLAATQFTKHFLEGKRITIPAIYPRDTKFAGRINGEIAADGEDLGMALLSAGQATPYRGEKRGPWCAGKSSP